MKIFLLILLLSISNAFSLEKIDNILTNSTYPSISYYDSIAYFVDGEGLKILKLNKSGTPDIIYEDTSIIYGTNKFARHGNTLYRINYSEYLWIYDVLPNDSLVEKKKIDLNLDGLIEKIEIFDGYMYLVNAGSLNGKNVNIYNLSDSLNPLWESGFGPASIVYKISIENDIATVLLSSSIQQYDISDKKNPTFLGRIDNGVTSGSLQSFFIQDSLLIISHGYGVSYSFIINDSSSIENVKFYPESFKSLYKKNDTLIGLYNDRLETVLNDDERNQTYLGHIKVAPNLLDLYLYGDYAYVLSERNGLFSIDIRNLKAKEIPFSFNAPNNPTGHYTDNDFIFITDSKYGLHIVDIQDPTRPKYLTSYHSIGISSGIDIRNDTCFLLNYSLGIEVLDISDRSNIKTLGQIADENLRGTNIRVRDSLAFITDSNFGFRIFNIKRNKSLGSCNIIGASNIIKILDTLAFVSSNDGYVYSISTSNPIVPLVLDTFKTTGTISDIQLHDNYLFISEPYIGLTVLDYSNPKKLLLMDTLKMPEGVKGLTIAEGYAYAIHQYSDSVSKYDITDITNISYVKAVSLNSIGTSNKITARDGFLFISSNEGLSVVDLNDFNNGSVKIHNNKYKVENKIDLNVFGNCVSVNLSEGEGVVNILNMRGQKVFSNFVDGNSLTINTSTLADGAYLIQFLNSKNNIMKKILIKD